MTGSSVLGFHITSTARSMAVRSSETCRCTGKCQVGWQSRPPVNIADARRQRRLRAWADRQLARRAPHTVYRRGMRLGVGLVVAMGILALIASGVVVGLGDRVEALISSPSAGGAQRVASADVSAPVACVQFFASIERPAFGPLSQVSTPPANQPSTARSSSMEAVKVAALPPRSPASGQCRPSSRAPASAAWGSKWCTACKDRQGGDGRCSSSLDEPFREPATPR